MVVAEAGLLIVGVSPLTYVQANEYGPVPPEAEAVTAELVLCRTVPDQDSDDGEIVTASELRLIVTDTSAVAVTAALSVTVSRNVAERLSEAARPVALKVVAAELALVIEIPVEPAIRVQA